MKLYRLQPALMYSVVGLFIVTCLDIVRKLVVKILNDFTIIDFSDLAIKLDSLNVSLLWNVTAVVAIVLLVTCIALALSYNERETAKWTNHIQKFIWKNAIPNAEDKADLDFNREVKHYNKNVASRLKVIIRDDTATFIAKFDNLADKNLFLADKDLIIQEVKDSLPEFIFAEFENGRMVGKRVGK